MANLRLEHVSRVHADGTRALSDVTLAVADGEVLALTGPSGSGKTTTLRVVAGLDPADGGSVRIDGEVVDDCSPRDRDVALVMQELTLYPYLTVEGNLRFPLQVRRVPAAEADQRVAAEARVLGLRHLLRRKPRTLSAGHRQAVALGRATARTPRVFLLDEPLSVLDARERVRMRAELRRFLTGLHAATLYATNDQAEAAVIGDRVAVLREGRVRQVGTPADLIDRPADRFVAGFFGTPAPSFAEVDFDVAGGVATYRLGGQRLHVPGLPGPLRPWAGRRLILGIRPYQLHDARVTPHTPADARLTGRVERVERQGADDLVFLRVGDALLSARFPPWSGPVPGTTAEVVVDTASLQAFDPVDGAAIWHGRPD